MSDFIRRMQAGLLFLRAGEGEGGAAPPPTETPPGDNVGGTPEGTTPPEGETPLEGAGAAPPETPPAQPDRPTPVQQRMNQLVAERWAERRRAEAAEQQANLLQEQLRQTRLALQPQQSTDADGNPTTPPPTQQPTRPTAPPQDLQRMAAEIAAQNEFNGQVAAEVARGRGVYSQDFDQVAANLQRFGELPRTFVEAALATGKGADVIYALGKDTLEADRILSLNPIQQAVALAALAQTIKTPEPPKVVTSAPPPVAPKVGSGKTTNTPSLEDENISTADWIALREKQLAAQKSSGGRPRR